MKRELDKSEREFADAIQAKLDKGENPVQVTHAHGRRILKKLVEGYTFAEAWVITLSIALLCMTPACGTDKRPLPACDALGCGQELLCSSKELCHCDGQACTP